MKATLVVKQGASKSQVIQLRTKSTMIGRMQGCDVRIPSKSVSRHHCKVRIKFDYVTVEDLDSANGTFINGERIGERKVLKPGDLLQVGPVVFAVKYQLSTVAEESSRDETVMKHFDAVAGLEDEEDEGDTPEPVDLQMDEDEEEEEEEQPAPPPSQATERTRTSNSLPTLPEVEKQKDGKKKKKTAAAENKSEDKPEEKSEDKPDAKKKKKKPTKEAAAGKPAPAKKNQADDDTPDASQILDDRQYDAPSSADMRSLFSQIEEE